MAASCTVDPACVTWQQPGLLLCDPCIDFGNPEHAALFDEAWSVVVSFLYTETGSCWPGTCFEETIRPCLDRPCPSVCPPSCSSCGIYNWLPLDGTCLPVVDICEVWVGGSCCRPEPFTWTADDGVRLETVFGQPRLVLESKTGCCANWPTQDLCRPTGEEHTWHVTVRTGCAPPPHVIHGAAEMASELVKGCIQFGCKMPGYLSSQSFDGNTVRHDPDKPTSLPLRMLERILDRTEKPLIEQFTTPTAWQFHNVSGPVRVDSCCGNCGVTCPTGSGCAQECDCDHAVLSLAVAGIV